MIDRITMGLLAFGLLLGGPSGARAEVAEVKLVQQFGATFVPFMVMENQKLIEKHATKAGFPDLKVQWSKLGGPSAINDALLSGSVHFSLQGVPSLALLWDRTRGGIGVKGVSGNCSGNFWLNVRSTTIKSLKDFTEKDRIAVSSAKVSTQAILLQMAAEREWGPGQHTKLDHLVIALSNPDGMIAVLNPTHEVDAHIATQPFHAGEVKGGLKTIFNGYDLLGGTAASNTMVSTEPFRAANPKVFAAVIAAHEEAMAWINADMRRTAKLFIELTREKQLTEDEVVALMSEPGFEYTRTPKKIGKFVEFMHRTGMIKNKAASWKELFFEEAHALQGD